MNKIKCLIVDDEAIAQRIITKYLADLPEFEVVGTCLHAIAARQILQEQQVDLMFLDIEMPKLKGLAFLKTLQHPPQVIITTAHREYALEGFELEVLDYLLKPISFERFLKAINRFQKIKPTPLPATNPALDAKFLYVKSERKTLKLVEDDIRYIEGMNNYIIIHIGAQSHIVYSSLTNLLEGLGEQFIRIHKSYVVNRRFILSFTKEIVELDKKELPIGKSFKEEIKRF